MDQASLLLGKQLKGEVASLVGCSCTHSRHCRHSGFSISTPKAHGIVGLSGMKARALCEGKCCYISKYSTCRAMCPSSICKRVATDTMKADLKTSCLAELTKHPVDGFSAGLVDESNLFEWQITIMGPPDTL